MQDFCYTEVHKMNILVYFAKNTDLPTHIFLKSIPAELFVLVA